MNRSHPLSLLFCLLLQLVSIQKTISLSDPKLPKHVSPKEKLKKEIEDVKEEIKDLHERLDVIANNRNNEKPEKDYCYTKECIEASNNFFKWMNLEADPCEDFNEFACGNFIKESRIPADKKRWTASDPLEETGMHY